MLQNLLASCGLNSSEQRVVLCLLERGATIASVIARHTGLKRPTVYAAIDNLLDYGLVNKSRQSGVTYFSLVPLKTIPAILENRAQQSFDQVQNSTRLLANQLSQFESRQPVELAGFSVAAIESSKAVYAELENALLSGDFSAIFNPQLAMPNQELEDLVAGFLLKTATLQPKIREIAVAGPKTDWYKNQIKNPNHELKVVPADQLIIADLILTNGSVYLGHYKTKKEVAIKVTEPDFYQTMRTIFEMLWQKL